MIVLWQIQKITVTVQFSLCFILILRAISKYTPPGAYIWRGDLKEGFLRYEFGGLIFGGAYFWKFTVFYFEKITRYYKAMNVKTSGFLN